MNRKRGTMKMQVIERGREVPKAEQKAVLLDISRRFRERQEQRLRRTVRRTGHAPDRMSTAKAMLAVETRLVEALWTLARLPGDRGIGYASRNGVGYLDERADLYANAVANGGWLTTAPRPAPPSSKAIDAMYEPLEWLQLLDRKTARFVTVVAQSKKGDAAANIPWSRVRKAMPELDAHTSNRLHKLYRNGLRDIVNELTLAKWRGLQ